MFRAAGARRASHAYSLHLRPYGKSAADLLLEEQLNEDLENIFEMLTLQEDLIQSTMAFMEPNNLQRLVRQRDDLYLIAASTQDELSELNDSSKIPFPDKIRKVRISLESFTDEEAEEMLGMSKTAVTQLFNAFGIPVEFVLNEDLENEENSLRHKFRVDGMHAFLYFLFRVYSTSERMALDQDRFGYDYSTLSKIFKAVVSFIDVNHKHLLRDSLTSHAHRFPNFNQVIVHTVREKNDLAHEDALPPDAVRCALFGDAMRLHVARPTGPLWMQRAVFNYHKWFHCHGSQGVMGPDGILYDWFDGPVGRRSDRYFLSQSGVNETMEDIQLTRDLFFWIYVDKGYDRR